MPERSQATEVLILGAGPAGIGAALALGDHALLLDKAADFGGLCKSIEFGGATFDLGGHSFHTPHPEVRDLVFQSLDMYEQERVARCYHDNQMIAYPFQQNFQELDNAQIVNDCARGIEEKSQREHWPHFGEFVDNQFGRGVARHFLRPYNEKLWGQDLARMDTSWVKQRVAGSNTRSDPSGVRRPLGSNTRVAYPAQGGFGEIFRALGNQVKHRQFGQEIQKIDLSQKMVWSRDGRSYAYDKLISTLPIPSLLSLVTQSIPAGLAKAANSLEAISMDLLLMAVDEPLQTPVQRIYNAEPDLPAHKIAINHNSSDWLRQKKQHGIIAEVSLANGQGRMTKESVHQLADALQKMGVVNSKASIREYRIVHLPRAYPVPTITRQSSVDLMHEYLKQHSVFSVGRFAEWAYINSDEALARGLQLGKRLQQSTGTTYASRSSATR